MVLLYLFLTFIFPGGFPKVESSEPDDMSPVALVSEHRQPKPDDVHDLAPLETWCRPWFKKQDKAARTD